MVKNNLQFWLLGSIMHHGNEMTKESRHKIKEGRLKIKK